MGSLRDYSGITAKVKAMRSKLLSREEYSHIAELSSVSEMAEYLKGREGYREAMGNADISRIHRETVEHAIMYSEYNDFRKLYSFVGLEQRKYLRLYFSTYEIELIKKAMRKSSTEYITEEQNRFIKAFFGKYSKVPFERLFEASDTEEIVQILKGTIYYEPMKLIMDSGGGGLFDYELALDMFYFRYMWKKRKINFSGKELRSFSDSIGTEADILNLTWIYRAKKFYSMSQSQIAALIIPVYYRIKKPQMIKLIEAKDTEELISEIGRTAYGKHFTPEVFKGTEMDKVSEKLVKSVYDKYYRLEPYSMAVLSSYLRDKKEEAGRLITMVECIRYGYSRDDIMKAIL